MAGKLKTVAVFPETGGCGAEDVNGPDDRWFPEPAQCRAGATDMRRLVWSLESGLTEDGDWEATAQYLEENGFTDVIARMARGGVAFYNSRLVPASPKVADEGDLLRKAVAACRKHGIRFHAWKVFFRMNMAPQDYVDKLEADGRYMYGRYGTPFCSVWQTPTGVSVEGVKNDYWMCPADPRNQAEEIGVLREMASLGVDGVHFDYIRYNAWYGCYCPRCRARYEARTGKQTANWPAEVDPMVALNPLWLRMRGETVTEIVRKGVAAVREVNPTCEISAAVFPGVDEHIYHAQPWRSWCREGLLDFVCPMTYGQNPDVLRGQVINLARTAMASPRTRIYPSVGLADGKATPEKIRELAAIVRWAGFPGVCHYVLDRKTGPNLAEAYRKRGTMGTEK